MKTVDITPTWRGVLPILLAAVNSDRFEAVRAAESELRRMAELADKWVEHCKERGE